MDRYKKDNFEIKQNPCSVSIENYTYQQTIKLSYPEEQTPTEILEFFYQR